MTIELTSHTHVFAYGVGGDAEDAFDIMGMCYRDQVEGEEPQPWTFRWRIRLHLDDKVFDSDDHKLWMHKTYPSDIDKDQLRTLFSEDWNRLHQRLETDFNEYVICDCSGSEALERISKLPWAHKAPTTLQQGEDT